mgnify:CR=1 FL=1
MRRKNYYCLLLYCLLSCCLLQSQTPDAGQLQWYPVNSWEIRELTRLYNSSQNSREQALLLLQKSQQSSRNLNESLALEKEKTSSLQQSYDKYKTAAQLSINRQAAEISQLSADKAAQKLKNQKLITIIVIESSVLAGILLLIIVYILLRIRGLVPF